jgi:hypothetical protein
MSWERGSAGISCVCGIFYSHGAISHDGGMPRRRAATSCHGGIPEGGSAISCQGAMSWLGWDVVRLRDIRPCTARYRTTAGCRISGYDIAPRRDIRGGRRDIASLRDIATQPGYRTEPRYPAEVGAISRSGAISRCRPGYLKSPGYRASSRISLRTRFANVHPYSLPFASVHGVLRDF